MALDTKFTFLTLWYSAVVLDVTLWNYCSPSSFHETCLSSTRQHPKLLPDPACFSSPRHSSVAIQTIAMLLHAKQTKIKVFLVNGSTTNTKISVLFIYVVCNDTHWIMLWDCRLNDWTDIMPVKSCFNNPQKFTVRGPSVPGVILVKLPG